MSYKYNLNKRLTYCCSIIDEKNIYFPIPKI